VAEKRRVQEPPIRIKTASKATAKRIADALGLNQIQVVEQAVDALGAYFDFHGGKLLLPLDFSQRFRVWTEPMILEERPVESKSVRAAARSKTNR
jgi:hypothetical protein